jgi:hypothetical protein
MSRSVRVFQPDRAAPVEHHSHALAIMAKAPVPGSVKSRLVPPLIDTRRLRSIAAFSAICAPRSNR